MFLKELRLPEIQPDGVLPRMIRLWRNQRLIWRNTKRRREANHSAGLFTRRSERDADPQQADVVMLNYMLPEQYSAASVLPICNFMNRAPFTTLH